MKAVHERRIWKDAGAGTVASYATALLNFLIIPITARALGPEPWGELAAAFAWVALLATVFHLSLGQVAVNLLSQWSHGRPREAGIAALVALWAGLSTIALAVAVAGWIATGGRLFGGISAKLFALCLLTLPAMIWTPVAQGLFQVEQKVSRYAFLVLASVAANVGVTAALVLLLGWGQGGVILGAFVGGVVIAVPTLAEVAPPLSAFRLRWRAVRPFLHGSLALHMTAVGNYVFASSDLLVVNEYAGTDEVGWYRLAVLLVATAMVVPMAVSSALFSLTAKVGPDAAWRMQSRTILVVGAGLVLGIVALYITAPWLVTIIGGTDYQPATRLLRILTLALPGMAASALMAPQMIGRGWFWQTTALTISIGLFNLGLNLLVVPRGGAVGAAWVRVACYAVVLLINLGAAYAFARKAAASRRAVGHE